MKDESFVEKILYRLVKKHVSGTTMSSALEKAREFNDKDMHASITFLSSATASKSKAKYITTTYQELVRQISRMGLKASIQVPLSQLGYESDPATAEELLKGIIETGNKYGVFVWAELPAERYANLNGLASYRGMGLAVPIRDLQKVARECKETRAIKAMFNEGEEKELESKSIIGEVERMAKSKTSTVLLSTPQAIAKKLLSAGKQKKSIIYEFRLGDSKKLAKRIIRRGGSVSVYLPFGKDWHAYAMNNVPEAYMRFLAGRLLKEGSESGV